MNKFRTEKTKDSDKDFEERKEVAIQKIKEKVFLATPRVKFRFSEKQLREEFEFDDLHRMYDKYDNYFTDATFILHPMEKIIVV